MSIERRVEKRDETFALRPGYALKVSPSEVTVVPTQDSTERPYNFDIRRAMPSGLAITAYRRVDGRSVSVDGLVDWKYVARHAQN